MTGVAHAEGPPPTPPAAAAAPAQNRIVCESRPGERQQCRADTSGGGALVKSTGVAPCLLGKTWGYDDTGIWVSDGCSGEFVAGQVSEESTTTKPLEH